MEKMRARVNKILNQHCDGITWLGNCIFISLMWVALSFVVFLIGDNDPNTFTLSMSNVKWTVIPFIPLFFINDWRRANSILDNNTKGLVVIIIMNALSIIDVFYEPLLVFGIMSAIMSIWILFANSKRKYNGKEGDIKAA